MDDLWRNEKRQLGRCINIDWLECFCTESIDNFPHDAQFFRDCGWSVIERPYGTRQYKEMFTLLDNEDHPFVEIRRAPVAAEDAVNRVGIFSEFSCHIRLSNRYCYHNNAVSIYSDFLARYDYTVGRIFRIDICLDFENFDKGDDPHKFLVRYMRGKYTKINQCELTAHAKDKWEHRDWNSASWGSPHSMVSTKIYNKTLELREVKDKPYIRYAWQAAGLVDNFMTLEKHKKDGTSYVPDIYRVEFSIKSSARSWVAIEDCNGKENIRTRIEHTLATYATKELQLHAFINLAHHYFHFKIFKKGERKDRCKDKILFDFGSNHKAYKLDTLLTDAPRDNAADSLSKKIREYRITHADETIRKACDIILDSLAQESIRHALPVTYDRNAAIMLQQLIGMRIKENPKKPLVEDVAVIRTLFDIADDIF